VPKIYQGYQNVSNDIELHRNPRTFIAHHLPAAFNYLSLEQFHPDPVREVRQKQDTLKVVTLARIQFAPGVVFHPITRFTQVGNFDTNGDNISIVVISRKNGTFVAIYRI